MWKLWKARLLWRTRLFYFYDNRQVDRSSHTGRRVYTALWKAAVGSVGNGGRIEEVRCGFPNSPDSHSRVLENLDPAPARSQSGDGHDSHFSEDTTGATRYVSILFLRILSVSPRRAVTGPAPGSSEAFAADGPPPAEGTGNADKTPCFPRPDDALGWLQSRGRRRAIPGGR